MLKHPGLRCCFLLALLLWSLPKIAAQNEAKIDSLTKIYDELAVDDSVRITALVDLWRVTARNDLKRAENYARRIIVESRQIDYLTGEATGYQRLGITQAHLGQKDSSVANYRKALAIYNRLESPDLQGVMLYNIAVYHQDAARYDSASHYLSLAQNRFEKGQNPQRLGAVLHSQAIILREQAHFSASLQVGLEAREAFLEAQDSLRLADVDMEIGFAYGDLNEATKALQAFQNAEAIYIAHDDLYYTVICRFNIAQHYQDLGRVDTSLIILSNAIEVAEQNEFFDLIIEGKSALASVLKQEEEYTSSTQIYQELLGLTQEVEMPIIRVAATNNLSEAANRKENWIKGLEYAKMSRRLASKHGLREELRNAHRNLSDAYAGLGNYRLALENQRSYQTINDSIYNAETTRQLAELQTRFETEQKERKIAEQASKLSLLEKEAVIDDLQKGVLWGGLVAAILLFGALAYSYRQRLRRTRIEKELEKERLEASLRSQQKELSAHILHLVQKNQMLDGLREELENIKGKDSEQQGSLNRLVHSIQNEEFVEHDWASFKNYFDQVHGDFEQRLKQQASDKLSPRELRLAALLKMGLTNSEVGAILNVSQDSLYKAKYRLRKKLPAQEGVTLDEFIQNA